MNAVREILVVFFSRAVTFGSDFTTNSDAVIKAGIGILILLVTGLLVVSTAFTIVSAALDAHQQLLTVAVGLYLGIGFLAVSLVRQSLGSDYSATAHSSGSGSSGSLEVSRERCNERYRTVAPNPA